MSSEERRLDYLNVSGKEYVPYVPADKVIPEFTATAIIIGFILVNCVRYGKCVSWSKGWDDRKRYHSGSSYFYGDLERNIKKRNDFGEHGSPVYCFLG